MTLTPLNIIVVEDDYALRELIITVLRSEGHQVSGLDSAESIDDEGGGTLIDLLITDLNLPGESGLSLAQRFRQAQPGSGVIMVTARDQVEDKVSGYEHGADIYLTKPIDSAELMAAVRAFSRRRQESQEQHALTLHSNHLNLDGPTKTVSVTHDEALILAGLARAPGHLLESWQLIELLSKDKEKEFSKSALEVRIVRLRKKITQSGCNQQAIRSIRGKGYQLSAPLRVL